ncbi:MAG: XRE family transcriptional regulator, partial [Tenericutes bacterium HGW-Tenericutes-7]
MFDMLKVGKKIASLRKDKNMTQLELADKLGI